MKYASFWMRLLAFICDYIIVLFIVFIASFIITVFQRFSTTYEEVILYNGLRYPTYLVFIWLYYSLMESSKYQGTLGKKLFKIKVTNLEGEKVSFGRSTARFFARLLSVLTFNIGFLIAAFTSKKTSLT
ncbi:RDD family protein [compost metagenome]